MSDGQIFGIAAACQRLTLSQTGGVGSIGVIALHVDQSVKDAKDGISYTAVYAGGHKNDFSPHQPLSPQASTVLQTEVDRLYARWHELEKLAADRFVASQGD